MRAGAVARSIGGSVLDCAAMARRRRTVPFGIGAALLLSAVVGCTGDDAGPSAAPTTAVPTTAADPLAEKRAQAPILGALLDGDGRGLRLYVLGRPEDYTAGSLTVELGPGTGTGPLRLLVRRADGASATPAGLVCRLDHDLHVLDVALDRPLGARAVLDASNGSVLQPMDAPEVVRPGRLPDGWRLLDEHPLREADAQTGWTQRYGRSDAEATISVVQRRAELGVPERYAVDRAEVEAVTVGATVATWSRQANGTATALVWEQEGWVVALSSSSPDGTRPALGREELVAFAATMSAGSGPLGARR